MTENNLFISICILSYNRPETLLRLLNTIGSDYHNSIEIVICEDFSPRRSEIRKVVETFRQNSPIKTRYFENEANLGFDGTFNNLRKSSSGRWLMFMGDDDEFVPGALDQMYSFLLENEDLGYVMKSHYLILEDGSKELFRYFRGTMHFCPGVETYTKLFRRSVFIAGFTIKRDLAIPYLTDRFDGSMLNQLYLLAEVTLKYPSAYLDIPLTQQYQSHDHNLGDIMFDREKRQFVERKPTLAISTKFLKSFSDITEYIDEKHGIQSSSFIKKDMSKYIYPTLSIHREH